MLESQSTVIEKLLFRLDFSTFDCNLKLIYLNKCKCTDFCNLYWDIYLLHSISCFYDQANFPILTKYPNRNWMKSAFLINLVIIFLLV